MRLLWRSALCVITKEQSGWTDRRREMWVLVWTARLQLTPELTHLADLPKIGHTCYVSPAWHVSFLFVSFFLNLFWHFPLPVFLQLRSGERSVHLQRSHVWSSLWSGGVWILLHRSGSLHIWSWGCQVWTCKSPLNLWTLTFHHLKYVLCGIYFSNLTKLFFKNSAVEDHFCQEKNKTDWRLRMIKSKFMRH